MGERFAQLRSGLRPRPMQQKVDLEEKIYILYHQLIFNLGAKGQEVEVRLIKAKTVASKLCCNGITQGSLKKY